MADSIYSRYLTVQANKRLRAFIRILLGTFWTLAAIFVVILALIVYAQQGREHAQRVKEEATVKAACVRERAFGPPFLAFLEGAEQQLHLNVLEKPISAFGKTETVIGFYRSTIPPSCPKR